MARMSQPDLWRGAAAVVLVVHANDPENAQ
jgi:hypothetical protein